MMENISIAEFHSRIKAQDVPREHVAVICPLCKTVQAMDDFIKANCSDPESSFGFSCIGRFTGSKAPRKTPDGQPCNWTLGGMFKMHELEVTTDDGKVHPHFVLASKEQAQSHMNAKSPTPPRCRRQVSNCPCGAD